MSTNDNVPSPPGLFSSAQSPHSSNQASDAPTEQGLGTRVGGYSTGSPTANQPVYQAQIPQARAGDIPPEGRPAPQSEDSRWTDQTGSVREPDQPAMRHGSRMGANDAMRRYGMGEQTPIAALDSALGRELMLFWEDFTENEVPIHRRSELVGEAVTSTILARQARGLPLGDPNSMNYCVSVMRRVALVVQMYLEMTGRNADSENSRYAPTPEFYIDRIHEGIKSDTPPGEIRAPVPRAPFNT
jgi:hypothetical protein